MYLLTYVTRIIKNEKTSVYTQQKLIGMLSKKIRILKDTKENVI